jgi:hypothetical protein
MHNLAGQAKGYLGGREAWDIHTDSTVHSLGERGAAAYQSVLTASRAF